MDDDTNLPEPEDVFDSTERLMRRISAQLTSQLARVRPPGDRPGEPGTPAGP